MASKRHSPTQAAYDPREVKMRIVDTPLKTEMDTSFLAYAYSVIYSRALPDARDGMKPVQRRIIYQMGEMHLTPDKPYMKSARAVGEVMGKLHPHGDSSIYEAMVRLAQPFAMRLPLVDGHGNFGSLDDGPAASRYTEARLAAAALAMNADIHEGTVPFSPNYDNKLSEPDVLPAAIPNLLVNGSQGIAVGMATNMITHNLREVVAAAKHVMLHPDATLDELMRFIPGPDLPGGGVIMGQSGIREAYETGRGTFVTRARAHVENVTARKKGIVITELPYMVGPEKVLERIGQCVKEKKLDGISDAVDLSDRTNGLKMVISVKSGFDPAAVLAQLYRNTPLESPFTINNVALVNGRPHTLGLKALLEVWINHRRDVITRRSQFRQRKAQERLHLVEGLLLALVDIDEVIQVIRSSENPEAARERLMAVFDLDEVQAKYILDLQLRRLTKMSRIELEAERDDLRRTIEELQEILDSDEKRDNVVIEEMDQAAKAYGDARRTVIMSDEGALVAAQGSLAGARSGGATTAAASGDGASGTAGVAGADALGAGLPPTASAPHGAHDLTVIDTAAVSQALKTQDASEVLQIDDAPATVVLSADGQIARMSESAMDLFSTRDASTPRAAHDAVRAAFATTTRSRYALITTAGRLVLANVMDLPVVAATPDLAVAHGVSADELLQYTHDTDPVAGEHVVAAIPLPSSDTSTLSLALGTAQGVVKRWSMDDIPTTLDSWPVISLKANDAGEMDQVVGAYLAHDEDRLVFITSDAKLLTFPASEVRAQGRNSAGMKGIALEEGKNGEASPRVLTFSVVAAGALSWTGDTSDPDADPAQFQGAVVLTVAGQRDLLPGTYPGFAKLTPLSQYPTKGRGTHGVRVQKFLVGQDKLIHAFVAPFPMHALDASGQPVELPSVDMRRDASGRELPAVIATLGL